MAICKRLAVLLVTLSLLLFPMAGPARATTPDKEQVAGDRMMKLGLVKGAGDGSDLALNANITRAQLVTILVRAFGQDANARFLQGSAAFTDSSNHPWASGYIAMAKRIIEDRSSGKEVIGLPDGSFNPDGNVTAAEAVAFLMKFTGAPKDQSLNWPNNYIQGALNAGMITAEDKAVLEGIKNAPATRGLVFYLADRSFYNYKLAEGGTVYTKYVDSTPPAISLGTYDQKVQGESATIPGLLSEKGILMAGDQPVSLSPNLTFTYTLTLAEGPNTVTFTATDLAGNQSAPAPVTVNRTKPAPAYTMTASLGSGVVPVGHEANLIVSFQANGQEMENPLPYTVTVDPSLGTYNPDARTFKASRTPGRGTLVVEAEGGLKAEVLVMVYNDTFIEVTPNNIFVKPGDVIQMSARAVDFLGNEEPVGTINWSVLMDRAEIDQTGKLTIPDIKGLLLVKATAGLRTGTASFRVGSGDIVIEAPVPARMKPGETVNIPIVVKQDGEIVKLPVQVDTKVGTWNAEAQLLTATMTPGKGNFLIYVGGVTREYVIEVVDETNP